MLPAVKKKQWMRLASVLLIWLVFTVGFILLPEAEAYAAGHGITISGSGLNVTEPVNITQEQLCGQEPLPIELQNIYGQEYLEQHDEWYSTINTWPTKNWYRGKGVRLSELLKTAGGLNDQARHIRFTSTDGFTTAYSIHTILEAPRYRFPNFMDTGPYGHLIGDASDPAPVETIIAYSIIYSDVLDEIWNDSWMSGNTANLLMFGQQAVTQQTNAQFAQYLKKIEVFTEPLTQWQEPTTSVTPGKVPAGTRVELKSQYNDEDKVHYTLDGSNPTVESPMYNWIASRWWSSRLEELDEINRPIEITGNTIIKAFVTGPGRENSDIATFEYTVSTSSTPFSIDENNPDDAFVNKEYNGYTFVAEGGEEPYSYAITAGSLPEGMVLTGAALEGTPTQSGSFTFTVTVTDSAEPENIISHDYILQVKEGILRPPELKPDSTGNTVGKSIDLTFNDDDLWRQVVSGITINGASIEDEYELKAGVITIPSSVFTAAGEYTINVIASGYLDAVVIQKITAGGSTPGGPGDDTILTIFGNGVSNPREYTLSQLEAMNQHQEVYSCINTWPSKRWYVGKGVRLMDLLNAAGIKGDARVIKFHSGDGYYMSLTVQELLEDTRYRFPNFKSGSDDADGHIPGSSAGAKRVDPILALICAEGTDDPSYMNESIAPLLMIGQRAVTEQTGPQFVKYVDEIEVMTNSPGQWSKPTADPRSGTVAAGTQVELHSIYDDEDKVYYTLDGSTPDMNSSMYNLVAKRWWASRGEDTVKKINKPIMLEKDTTIKAITIGPGRMNSDVAEFTYKVTGIADNTSGNVQPGSGGKVSLGEEAVIVIPDGALSGSNSVEVKIEREAAPPAVPTGFKIIAGVYKFTMDGRTDYSFNKPVTIKLRINTKEIMPGEIPAIYFYNLEDEKWIDIGGQAAGDYMEVQVEHLGLFAIMVREAEEPLKIGISDTIHIPLNDIDGHWAEAFIEKLIILGAISGYPDGTFRPDNRITRAEFVSILIKAFELQAPRTGEDFADIAGHWAAGAIATAAHHDIVKGYGDNLFGPDGYITREQMALMLVKAVGVNLVDESTLFADDSSISEWARGALAAAANNGIINGYPDNTVRPQENASRAEAVTMIVNAMDKLNTETKID